MICLKHSMHWSLSCVHKPGASGRFAALCFTPITNERDRFAGQLVGVQADRRRMRTLWSSQVPQGKHKPPQINTVCGVLFKNALRDFSHVHGAVKCPFIACSRSNSTVQCSTVQQAVVLCYFAVSWAGRGPTDCITRPTLRSTFYDHDRQEERFTTTYSIGFDYRASLLFFSKSKSSRLVRGSIQSFVDDRRGSDALSVSHHMFGQIHSRLQHNTPQFSVFSQKYAHPQKPLTKSIANSTFPV